MTNDINLWKVYVRALKERADKGMMAQKDAMTEYAIGNGMEPFVVDYRADYDFIMLLQKELTEGDPTNHREVKALAATYELQDYLANRITKAVADGELERDPED